MKEQVEIRKTPAGQQEYSSRDSIGDIWGRRTPHYGQWSERIDERTLEVPERWIQSTCVFCSTGCGMDIGMKGDRMVGVRGRGVDRVNLGRLGPKGLNGWEANYSPNRLTTPMIRREGKLQPATWEEAMQLIVRRTLEIKEKYTGNAIGFYNSGQLFLEEYYTLSIIGDCGVETNHMDGNTRLCTATSAMALMESFGTDGDPGSYADLDITDTILHIGHNPAFTQTVLWMRILDRLEGPNPPTLIVIDPRVTETAKKANIHLRPKLGTNLALLNGLLNLIIENNQTDLYYIDQHTVGFEDLKAVVNNYPVAKVSEITGIPPFMIREAAEVIGNTRSMVSTVLQGVYQSWQATASAIQVNNLHLIRGLIGKEGSTVFQMNGQPTAQNTRECGANGELVAFRNWNNPEHIADLARIWNVRPEDIPHEKPPTHAMEIFRLAEEGSIRMLWIIATNPAVSLPELERIRRILKKEELFVIVQDGFFNETAALADVILPAALWGEKTGCFTNADRTVHISHQAINPPGQARADFDIFIDYANRMNFKDKDGKPLIKWTSPEEAFEAFKEVTRGRPCDYTGLSYEKLSQGSGIQYPCNESAPEGTPRLYTDGFFNTSADYCEIYGHDIMTGAAITPEKYRAHDPKGKARIKGADFVEPPEVPNEEYPFYLTTGRVVYQFHTRTKTKNAIQLDQAAPDAWVQLSEFDASEANIQEGDWVEVSTRRGKVQVRAQIGEIPSGNLFIPFHYGYWDHPDHKRAANELTLTGYDPVSKQPYFKFAAARIKKL